jgi:hypothetical protein
LTRPAPDAGRYSHAANREAVAADLAPNLLGLVRQARGAGNSDASVLDAVQRDAALRGRLAAAVGRRHVFSAETAKRAWELARELGRAS